MAGVIWGAFSWKSAGRPIIFFYGGIKNRGYLGNLGDQIHPMVVQGLWFPEGDVAIFRGYIAQILATARIVKEWRYDRHSNEVEHLIWATQSSDLLNIIEHFLLILEIQEAGRIAARILLGTPNSPSSFSDLPEAQKSLFGDLSSHHSDPVNEWGFWWIPAGRLPFTWYGSLAHVPQITDYEVYNHTYRFDQYYTCPRNGTDVCQEVTFPFGYGLSYNYAPTSNNGGGFAYRNLDIPALTVSSKVGFTFTVEVVNRGVLAADEVVQVYYDWLTLFGFKVTDNFEGHYKAATRQLIGFERVSLMPGEVRRLRFLVKPEQLWVWSYVTKDVSPLCPANAVNGSLCGAPVAGEGTARLSVGGQQPLQKKSVGSNVIIAMLVVVKE